MSLIDRLAGIQTDPENNPKLAIDSFWACLYELAQGQMTQASISSYFGLSAEEETELAWLVGRYNAQPNSTAKARFVELVRVIMMLAEARVPGYTTNADIVARLNAV